MPSITCHRCGESLDVSDNFCPHCGLELDAGEATGVIPRVDDSGPIPAMHVHAVDDLPEGTSVLVVRRGPDEGARFVLDGDEQVFGRAPESTIFLDDVTVSRRHALLTRDGQEWVLSDDGSLNGTYVNRALVGVPVRLRVGDEVQIGKYRFVYLVSPGSGGRGGL